MRMMQMAAAAAAAAAAMALLAGCAAQVPPVRVTRFHLNQPIAGGEIRVEPRDQAQAASLEYEAYASTVGTALRSAGFRLAPDLPRSELVAVIELSRASRQAGPAQSPFSIGIGGGTGGGGFGVGGGISIPIGKPRATEVVGTELFVQIRRRSDGTAVWEGRALTEAREGTPYAAPTAAAQKLADALFRDFPGESGRTISVK